MSGKRTLVFIPTYDESENVGAMCEQILALGLDADLCFCDDASPDGTGRLIDELAARHPRVLAMHRSGKLGIGSAHLDGIAWAYEHGYERLITLDCDFTHSPADIPRMIAAGESSGAALVVASRWHAGDSLPGWSPIRKGLTTLGHVLTKSMLGVTNDATGAFRIYDLRKIPRRLFDLVTEKGYAFFFQSMFILTENRFPIVEIPIVLPARTYGHSKMSMLEVKRSVEQLAKLFVARQTNPAQFRLGKEVPGLDPALIDPQDWDAYWEKKDKAGALVYDAVAAAYRNIFIKSNLNRVIHQEFGRGARLLHAGCGSGQVDTDLHDYVDVTAVDISPQALSRYTRENPRVHEVRHADILRLPFDDGAFDGVYNLGVVEHFGGDSLGSLFHELARVTRPGGKVVTFWPHKYATSAFVLDSIHYVLNDVMKKDVQLHPPEPSRIGSRADAQRTFADAGLDLVRYDFGARDLFVQAIAVGKRRDDPPRA
ncbi:MAG: methyltransferase domain-containing protein [Labilithrix sp.]|nr:methyltransferase domain-containing protein [Labilithrix sp.]MCW5816955.1 methyltransferase domain-containing protein [Labilithrix sp.]